MTFISLSIDVILSGFAQNSKQVLPKIQEDENSKSGSGKDHPVNVEKKGGEEAESHKCIENKSRNVDLRLNLEKSEREIGDGVNAAGNSKSQLQQNHKQQQQQIPLTEKSGKFPFYGHHKLIGKFKKFLNLSLVAF